MTNHQPDESRGTEHLPQDEQEATPGRPSSIDTPIDAARRKTGASMGSDAKSTAVSESGSSDSQIEGAPNQGTEKR